jgi:hypothetical protein
MSVPKTREYWDRYEEGFLEKQRKRYEAGDKSALIYCMEHCLRNHTAIPEWVETAFLRGCQDVRNLKVKSWDDVFGRRLKKGARLATERRNSDLVGHIYSRVGELRDAGESINKNLFDRLGKELGISGSTARDLYYATLKNLEEMAADDAELDAYANSKEI